MRPMRTHVTPRACVKLAAHSDTATNFLGFVVVVEARCNLTGRRRTVKRNRFNAKRWSIESALAMAERAFARQVEIRPV